MLNEWIFFDCVLASAFLFFVSKRRLACLMRRSFQIFSRMKKVEAQRWLWSHLRLFFLAAVHFEYIFEVYGKDGESRMQAVAAFPKAPSFERNKSSYYSSSSSSSSNSSKEAAVELAM